MATLRCSCVAAPARRLPSTRRLASTLVFLEQRQGKLTPSVLNTLTAASSIGGEVHGVVVGGPEDGVDAAADQAKGCAAVSPVPL